MNAVLGHALLNHLHVALLAVAATVVFSVFVLTHSDWFRLSDATGVFGTNRCLVKEGIIKYSLLLVRLRYRLRGAKLGKGFKRLLECAGSWSHPVERLRDRLLY